MFGGILDSFTNAALGTVSLGLEAFNMYQQQKNFNTNYAWQKSLFGYNADLQNQMLSREDTAVQRRVTDLKAAGLSPVLAAGQAANAGPVIHQDAPERQRAQIPDLLGSVMSLMKMKEDISNTVAQRSLINAQKAQSISSTMNNLFNLDKTDSEIKNKNIETAIKAHDYEIFKATGTTSNSGSVVKDLRNIFGASQSPIGKGVLGEVFDKISKDYQDNIDGYNKRQQKRNQKRR